VSPLAPDNGAQTLPKIYCCVMRSMDRKFWTYARPSYLQRAQIEAPVRSATSHLNLEPDSYGHEEPMQGCSTLRLNQDIGKGQAISM
jgi:hypothetical protein